MTYRLILSISVILGILIIMNLYIEPQLLKDVKSGKYTLTCQFKDEWRDISKDMIVNYNEDSGYWEFKNGYAKNCEVF